MQIRRMILAAILAFGAAGTGQARAPEALLGAFDPAGLAPQEIRLLEAALAGEGDFAGTPDSRWDAESAHALAAYSAREFDQSPRDLHAAALAISLLADVETGGWTVQHFSDLGISMALPEAILEPPEPEDSGTRWWSRTGSLTLLTHRFGPVEAEAWHLAAAAAHAGGPGPVTRRDPELWITAGHMADGRTFHTRSERRDGVWSTVFLASGPDEAAMLNLIRASLGAETPDFWDLPPGGRLDALVRDTLALFAEPGDGWEDTGPAPGGFGAGAFAPDGPEASGTAFYIGPDVLVTADHVVAGCARLALGSGAPVSVIASNSDLDVALLSTAARSEVWLAPPAPAAEARLGQRVHAAGYPYFGIASSALHLTGGNVSARTGLNDDDRFFSFTAPVQPGNSGGPLVDRTGALVGLVVSRLSERYIAEATGSLPQNINYALHVTELNKFISRNGVRPAPGELGRFDMEAGAPAGFETAIVPLLCN